MSGSSTKAARRYTRGASPEERDELVVIEEPLEIRIAGDTFAVTMRTPGHDQELAVGLLFSEGIVAARDDLGAVAHCGRPGDEGYGNTIEVTAGAGARLDLDRALAGRRGTLTTAACGVCGRRAIDDLISRVKPLDDGGRFSTSILTELTDRLRERQPLFAKTGGLHAAGAANERGELIVVREDVGRHNAVDKVVGRLLLDERLPATGQALVVSGRVSFEIIQKAVAAGFGAVVAVSAPTSLAIETAERTGLLLAGFSRGGAMNVYAGSKRLSDA